MSKELLVPKKYICIKKLAFFPQNSYLFQKSKKVFLSGIRAVPGFKFKTKPVVSTHAGSKFWAYLVESTLPANLRIFNTDL